MKVASLITTILMVTPSVCPVTVNTEALNLPECVWKEKSERLNEHGGYKGDGRYERSLKGGMDMKEAR